MSIDKILIPKKVWISPIIAKTAINTTKPISALVILFFADSTAAFSPPERIQVIAPQTSMKKKPSEPTMRSKLIIFGKNTVKNSSEELVSKDFKVSPTTGFVNF